MTRGEGGKWGGPISPCHCLLEDKLNIYIFFYCYTVDQGIYIHYNDALPNADGSALVTKKVNKKSEQWYDNVQLSRNILLTCSTFLDIHKKVLSENINVLGKYNILYL